MEALRAAGGGGWVEELDEIAVTGNIGTDSDPDAAGEIRAAFHGVGATGDGGEFESDIRASGARGAEAQGAPGVARVGAAGALSGVEGGGGFFGIGETVAVEVNANSRSTRRPQTARQLIE